MHGFASTESEHSWRSEAAGLHCGSTYFVSVRATNCAGLQRTVASEAAKVCCDPPTSGRVELVNTNGRALRFVGADAMSDLSVHWSGFADGCSGMREYSAVLVSGEGGDALWNSSANSTTSHLALPRQSLVGLVDGSSYSVVVRGTTHAGLWSEAAASFVLDRTPLALSPVVISSTDAHGDTLLLPTHGEGEGVACVPSHAESVRLRWQMPGKSKVIGHR